MNTTQAVRWLRRNLFAGRADAAVTLVLAPLTLWALLSVGHWALWGADWSAVTGNLKVMLVGTFPAELLPRAWVWTAMLSGLVGATLGTISPMGWPRIRAAAFALVALGIWAGFAPQAWVPNAFLCVGAAFAAATLSSRSARVRKLLGPLWLAGLCASGVLLPPAGLDRWGGLMLGVLMTLLASALSLPLGVLLAFGRRSKMAGLRLVCIGYIELMRSLPLILVVYWIWVITPLVAPGTPVPDVLRGLLGFSLFFAAYVAEYVRSGLQAVPKGQVEAAASLGMTQGQINRDIVLPQAMKVVTPALVGNVLDIFNNMPLLFIIGLTEFLRAGQMVLANPQSASRTYELYAFMFVVYLATASLITFGARRLEARMAAGHR